MPKCMPTDTNQHNPTKIIDGCQVLKEISADINSCGQKMKLCNMAELRKRKWNSQCCATLWQGEFYIRWQHLILIILLCTQFSCIKKTGQYCICCCCWAIALPSTKQIVVFLMHPLKHINLPILSNITGRPLLKMLESPLPLPNTFMKGTPVCTTYVSE